MRIDNRRAAVAGMAVMAMLMSLMVVTPAVPAAAASTEVVFDDMEHGNPFGNGWFAFGGSVGGGGIGPNTADLPPVDGGAFSLETGWGSGGTPGFFGGFGRTSPSDLSEALYFNFWINPDPGQDYTLEINLQEDDDGDDAIGSPADDEFQYNCVVSPSGPCAVSGGGWQLLSIPLADFFDDNSVLTGGNGVLDAVPASAGGNGQLINVVIAVIGNTGSDATFRSDYWTFTDAPQVVPTVIDDFESGVSPGTPCTPGALPVGFCTFSDAASSVSIVTTDSPPVPVPGSEVGNHVLEVATNVSSGGGFAGVIRGFTTPQDWSRSEGLALWLYGNNTGKVLFIDILDNRAPGSTGDTAERFSVDIIDDFSGWQFVEIPFDSLDRKEVGNGAPNDGLTLTEVHGWAFGVFDAGEAFDNYLDDVSLYGVAELPDLTVNFSTSIFTITEGTTGPVTVKLNRPFTDEDPDEVSVDFTTEPGTAEPGRDYTPVSGKLTFTKAEADTERTFSIETFGDDKFFGNERIVLRLRNPVDVELGTGFQASAIIVDADPFDSKLLDDFERGAYLWDASSNVTVSNPEYTPASPMAIPGQGAYESVLRATVLPPENIEVLGRICNTGTGVIPVRIRSTDSFDATTIDHTTVRLGNASEAHVDRKSGVARRHQAGGDLLFHFRFADTGLPCDPGFVPLTGLTFDGEPILLWRDFPLAQDWSRDEALSFWYYGTGSGDEIGVTLKDNAAADPGPSGWVEVWADEFDGAADTPPNPENWTHEIGDVTPDGKNGWGNSELQYYTDDPANAAHDGDGNLVITLRAADGSLECYYGPCEYTSARLLSWHKAEFAYGRVESRLKLPAVGSDLDGLWPAFWSLGTDIDRNPWPLAGEIDFMEWVGRIPDEIFGTIHGPGYSGGASFGGTRELVGLDEFHEFAVEWEPNEIRWYLDGELYHSATPANVAPNQWVFDKPFFMLLNFAIGGNFGGEVGENVTFPQKYLVDYVRLYSAPDTAERWDSSFTDDFVGWREVTVAFDSFSRSLSQPAGAPDDGLGLEEVWGYGFTVPGGGTLHVDRVRLDPAPRPTTFVVTNLDNAGKGSLRDGVGYVADGGTITFDPAIAGGTINLTSGPIVLGRDVTIDAGDAPGVSVDGGRIDRVLVVDAGTTASVANLTMTNGFGFQLAGCVLNNGSLTLDHVTVTGCTMTTDAGDFWQGGGGIYNGDGAVLHLLDSAVRDNAAAWSGGGVYSFFNTTTIVERSTISGNVSNDVGGGLRLLGDAEIVNSTISGNTSTGWHGSAIFQTDGDVSISSSTIANNVGPDWAPSTLFIGQFGGGFVPTLTLRDTIITGNQWYACERFDSGTVGNVVSAGHNVVQDDSCNRVSSDQIVWDALIGPLADNGGPTATHALLTGSPAIDTAGADACPATDQRGIARPQGSRCDVGAFEYEPPAP